MRAVIQRVSSASVAVAEETIGAIGHGMLVLLGAAHDDSQDDIDYLIQKLINLRIFNDDAGKMNLSICDVKGSFLVVSQFTIMGSCAKGRRPSFDGAAAPVVAEKMYDQFVVKLRAMGLVVETGKFRAAMKVSLVNDGPVTFMLDSKE